jgi:predicted dehydrogenase
LTLDYRPSFPVDRTYGIGLVGCGTVARRGHLPAYEKYGCTVVGVHDVSAAATRDLGLPVFDRLDDLLAHPDVAIVDIATPPETRAHVVRRALAAGKHVLSQKPLATTLDEARSLVDAAERHALLLAVNQNARWAPSWRVATLLIDRRFAGNVLSVTHLLEKRFDFASETPHLDAMPHFLLFDYLIHWIDITRCWLEPKQPTAVRAVEHRTPDQPARSTAPWGGTVEIDYEDGSTAAVRSAGGSASPPRCSFWIHGTAGTIRGGVLHDEFVELDRADGVRRFPLDGAWWPDGFAGAMGELMSAVAEGREPYNSARHNLLSLELTLAACRSAEHGGHPVNVGARRTPRAQT